MNHTGKKTGGNTCSIFNKVTQTSPSSQYMCSWVKFVEHRPLKNADISTRGLTTLSGSDQGNAIGRTFCIIMWLSWLFNPDIVHSLRHTHRETFDTYSSAPLDFESPSENLFSLHWTLCGQPLPYRFYYHRLCTNAV